MEMLLKEKYLQASSELFRDLANNDQTALSKRLQTLDFEVIPEPSRVLETSRSVYEKSSSFGEVKIIVDAKGQYFLLLSYLDESLLIRDKNQEEGVFARGDGDLLYRCRYFRACCDFLAHCKTSSSSKTDQPYVKILW